MWIPAQYSYFFIVFSTVLLVQLSSYESQGTEDRTPYTDRKSLKILYGTFGGGSSPHDQSIYNSWASKSWNFDPGSQPLSIPPAFITGAKVYDAESFHGSRLSLKPKRWTQVRTGQSAPMEAEEEESEDSDTEEDAAESSDLSESEMTSEDEASVRPPSDLMDNRAQHISEAAYRAPLYPTAFDPYYKQYSEAGEFYPESRIRQEYLAASHGAPAYFPTETDSYKVVMEKEYQEPARRVHRTAAPWPRRDVARLGDPRHGACNLPLDRGVGPDDLSSWFYDNRLGECRWFGYRGHGGNANRFYSRLACEAYCVEDVDDLCRTVQCPTSGLSCSMVEDDICKRKQEHQGRDWRVQCPPDQPVCMSRRGTRIAPNASDRPIPPECFQSKDSGTCQKKNPTVAYHYDSERNACMTFYFHECGGNDNRFETKSECMTHCSP